MKIMDVYDYRSAHGILASRKESVLDEVLSILNDETKSLALNAARGAQRNLQSQIQRFFVKAGWERERSHFSIPDLKYDLVKEDIPIEIEIGHERLVYADFFKFLVDYSNGYIPAGIIVATENPESFGHTWHNSRESTARKIEAIKRSLLVPILVIGIKP